MKWKAPVLYTAMGVLIGSTFMAATPAFASLNFKPFQANLVQDGQVVSKPSAIAYNGTSYFGIWWLQQQLKKDGIEVQWDGKSFTLTNMPVQTSDTLSVQGAGTSGSTQFANTINVNGVTYIPLSEVQALLKDAGSQVQIHTGHGDDEDNQDSSNLQGVINQLKHINEKLTEFQQGQAHGDGEGEGELFSSFAGSLMQLQVVITELNQVSQVSTSGTSTTSGSTTTSGTNSTSSSTGSGSTTSGTTSGTTSTTASPAQLSDVVASLQNDWKALNAYALQVATGTSTSSTSTTTSSSSTTSGSTGSSSGTSTSSGTTDTSSTAPTDLSSVITDINKQIQALSAMTGQGHVGENLPGEDH